MGFTQPLLLSVRQQQQEVRQGKWHVEHQPTALNTASGRAGGVAHLSFLEGGRVATGKVLAAVWHGFVRGNQIQQLRLSQKAEAATLAGLLTASISSRGLMNASVTC